MPVMPMAITFCLARPPAAGAEPTHDALVEAAGGVAPQVLSDDNAFSEAQLKTLKCQPDYPASTHTGTTSDAPEPGATPAAARPLPLTSQSRNAPLRAIHA
ncbi:hypothetical protein [Sorangium sp. So ce590]|uniref:hypothetical protein n=1 Tax=unclassified Sorangium TaxID=2621164 RepID=UPI003F601D93